MNLLGVVFAGGQSTRMGRPKALLPWPRPGGGDEPLILRAAAWLSGLCSSVEVAAGAQWDEIQGGLGDGPQSTGGPSDVTLYTSFGALARIQDAQVGVGPLGGLVAALERSVALGLDGTLILACDMPLVEGADVQPLIDRVASGADAALWTVDGYDQPLCAVYGPRTAEAARLALARKARRPVAIFDEIVADGRPLQVERLIPSENSRVRLMNVNTPSDYDLARRRFHECQGRSASSPSGPDRR